MKKLIALGASSIVVAGCNGETIGRDINVETGGYSVSCDQMSETPLNSDYYCGSDQPEAIVEPFNRGEAVEKYRSVLNCIFEGLPLSISLSSNGQATPSKDNIYLGGLAEPMGGGYYGGLTVTRRQGSDLSVYAMVTDRKPEGDSISNCNVLLNTTHEMGHMVMRLEDDSVIPGLDDNNHELDASTSIMAARTSCKKTNWSFGHVSAKLIASRLYEGEGSSSEINSAANSLKTAGTRCRSQIDEVIALDED